MAQTPEEIAAREAVQAQHLARDDRQIAAQRANVDTAKLVATFVLALAGTLVGTALQVDPRGALDLTAVIIMAVSLLGVLAVIVLDSLDVPVFDSVTPGIPEDQQLIEMRVIVQTIINSNEKTVRRVRQFATASIVLSAGAGVVSAWSLLLK